MPERHTHETQEPGRLTWEATDGSSNKKTPPRGNSDRLAFLANYSLAREIVCYGI